MFPGCGGLVSGTHRGGHFHEVTGGLQSGAGTRAFKFEADSQAVPDKDSSTRKEFRMLSKALEEL